VRTRLLEQRLFEKPGLFVTSPWFERSWQSDHGAVNSVTSWPPVHDQGAWSHAAARTAGQSISCQLSLSYSAASTARWVVSAWRFTRKRAGTDRPSLGTQHKLRRLRLLPNSLDSEAIW